MLMPQHMPAPVFVTPHVCWLPAVIEANFKAPMTGTGLSTSMTLPLPSTPEIPLPQQNAAPAAVRPQTSQLLELIDRNRIPPPTGVGTVDAAAERLACCADRSPQHHG